MQLSAAHYARLDAIRGIAAQPVVIGHAAWFMFPAGLGALSELLGWSARLSVLVFFVLSGFVITQSIAREIEAAGTFDWGRYAVRRIARIYPPYSVAILLVAALAAARLLGADLVGMGGPVPGFDAGPWSWPRALAFVYTSRDGISVLDGPVWSLRIEVGLYAIAALTALSLASRGVWRAAVASGAIVLIALLLWRQAYATIGIGAFAAGGGAAIAHAYIAKIPPWATRGAGSCALLLPLVISGLTDDSPGSTVYQCVLSAFVAAILVSITKTSPRNTRPGNLATASGAWSYTLYITHCPVIGLLLVAFTPERLEKCDDIERVILWVAGVVLANVIAYGIARSVERPKYFAEMLFRLLSPRLKPRLKQG